MYFEIYQEKAVVQGLRIGTTLLTQKGAWRWRLKSANHEIVASGEDYHNEKDCLHAIDLVKGLSASTEVKRV